jgi:predicted ATP-dependent protease
MAESVVVQSKLKDAVKNLELRMDGNLPDALNQKVHELLQEAAKRAKENGRSTLRPHDL